MSVHLISVLQYYDLQFLDTDCTLSQCLFHYCFEYTFLKVPICLCVSQPPFQFPLCIQLHASLSCSYCHYYKRISKTPCSTVSCKLFPHAVSYVIPELRYLPSLISVCSSWSQFSRLMISSIYIKFMFEVHDLQSMLIKQYPSCWNVHHVTWTQHEKLVSRDRLWPKGDVRTEDLVEIRRCSVSLIMY
jgi:hypothetical protein